MFSFYVYHGRSRGVIFADNLDHAKEKFESKNAERGLVLRVWKTKNAHSLETKVFKKTK